MNIHIIASRLGHDRVLPRLARTLADNTGWGLSERPNPGADLNYFLPYIDAKRYLNWSKTPKAAWFTHKDTSWPKKEEMWDSVAKNLDLRLTSAPMYLNDLGRHGLTALVRPPVERDHFTIARRAVHSTPVVGVSGYTYDDGRKGEDMLVRLTRTKAGQRCTWQASGRGWPGLATKGYEWKDLPKFFQSLDIFLCLSRIEGVPLPPLEALACGVPVVIPQGVGLLDELPDMPGIYRFQPGDHDSAETALTEALDSKRVNRQDLRKVTEPYSVENWAQDHETAFENLLYPAYQVETLPDWRGNSGIYVVAFGGPSRKCAVRCISAAKEQMPDVPVVLVSDRPINAGEDIFIEQEDRDIGGRLSKLAVDRLAPESWKYVLFLDADTEPVEPLGFLFELLASGWEAVICKDMDKYHFVGMMKRPDNHAEFEETINFLGTEHVMQYNAGVFGFRRCDNTKRLFELWNVEYQKYCGRDQGALFRALHSNPLRLCVLTNHWNASVRYPFPPGDIAVKHYNMEARRWSRPIKGRIDSSDAWQAVKEWEAANG